MKSATGRWVRGYDGQLRPVSADPISQRLFLAAERMQQPNAFLARELADRCVDWLLDDPEPLDEAELHEQVVKLVREFGHPALALAYAAESLPTATSTSSGWPRDVDSLVRGGLLCIRPSSEDRLADVAWTAPRDLEREDAGLHERLRHARRLASAVTLDHLDDWLALRAGDVRGSAQNLAEVLIESARRNDLPVSVHLNVARSTTGKTDGEIGPLFADLVDPADESRRRVGALALAEALARESRIRIYWHVPLAERNTMPPGGCPGELGRLIEAEAPLVWVFDRPGETISLGPGLSRDHRSVLLFVGCHLFRLVEQLAPSRLEVYLEKLATLARLARSAARHRLHRLRELGNLELSQGFLLERSRFVLVPIGLEAAIIRLAESVGAAGADLGHLAEQVVGTMRQAVEKANGGPPWGVLDGMPGRDFLPIGGTDDDAGDSMPWGVTGWDPEAGLMEQLRWVERFHRTAASGTAAIWLPADSGMDADQLCGILQRIARRDIRGVHFLRRWKTRIPPPTD